jgi:hypothetical protein
LICSNIDLLAKVVEGKPPIAKPNYLALADLPKSFIVEEVLT